MNDARFTELAHSLSPTRPIRTPEFLRGRAVDLVKIQRELQHFHASVFIYGFRGVGKTSLARTAAQLVNSSEFEHVYVACAPGSRMLHIVREIGEEMLKALFRLGAIETIRKQVEIEVSLSPAIKASFEKAQAALPEFTDVNGAVSVLKDLDSLFPETTNIVAILDELEELETTDRTDLAYIIKQIGDQEFKTRFVFVGIASNVHELIGAHASVPRYIKEVSLDPLYPQNLMDIVSEAATAVSVDIDRNILIRIAIIGNGYPHFAHLLGQSLLIEAIERDAYVVTDEIYMAGVEKAVEDSKEELKSSYEAATQRGQDYFRHLIWALADSDVVDLRIDEWISAYKVLTDRMNLSEADETKLRTAIGNFNKESYGSIIMNTPAAYGSATIRYRYKRFSDTLMRGHVRLQAEKAKVKLGRQVTA